MPDIRFARAEDLAAAPDIERAAGAAFRGLGMDAVADDEPPSLAELARYQRDGRMVVADDDGRVLGYLILDLLAGAAHIEQVSVDPAAAGRGIGRQLIAAAAIWAGARGLPRVTLTSYRDVPWNAPYYARLGFVVLPDADQPPELRAVRRAEQARGLDRWPRVAMYRPTGPVPWPGR